MGKTSTFCKFIGYFIKADLVKHIVLLFSFIALSSSFAYSNQPILKIGLLETDSNLVINLSGGGKIYIRENAKNSLKTLSNINQNTSIIILYPSHLRSEKEIKNIVKKDKNKIFLHIFQNKTLIFSSNKGIISINNSSYRGNIIITFDAFKRKIKVINEIEIEKYLSGVVGAEISSLAPFEALKAQAVIARTYALANLGKHSSDGYDLCATEHCQVYGGIKSERPNVTKAVEETKGIIMIYHGQPISSLYHATCGGFTSDNDKVFGGHPVPYLRRVKCTFCKSAPNYRWFRKIMISDIIKIAQSFYRNVDISNLHDISKISLLSHGYLDRVESISIITKNNKVLSIKGTYFRQILNLPSTTFAFKFDDTNNDYKPLLHDSKEHFAKKFVTPSLNNRIIIKSISPKQFKQSYIYVITSMKTQKLDLNKCQKLYFLLFNNESDRSHNITSYQIYDLPTGSPKVGHQRLYSYYLDGKFVQELFLNKKELNTSILIIGRGFGHQVGLCQAGAIELARKGWNFRQILPFYYQNTLLKKLKY